MKISVEWLQEYLEIHESPEKLKEDLTMIGLLVVFSRPLMDGLGITGSQFTSLVQGSARWHTFIAFAIIPLTFGTKALSLGAVSAAAMTPLLNIVCVIVMAHFAHANRPSAKVMALVLADQKLLHRAQCG